MTSEADEILLKKIMKKKKGDFNKWFLGGNTYSSPWYIFLNNSDP